MLLARLTESGVLGVRGGEGPTALSCAASESCLPPGEGQLLRSASSAAMAVAAASVVAVVASSGRSDSSVRKEGRRRGVAETRALRGLARRTTWSAPAREFATHARTQPRTTRQREPHRAIVAISQPSQVLPWPKGDATSSRSVCSSALTPGPRGGAAGGGRGGGIAGEGGGGGGCGLGGGGGGGEAG